jgi:hypothetical protein
MRWLLLLLMLAPLGACSSSKSSSAGHTPAGTPDDPVDVCTRAADVCRLDSARLGVCNQAPPDTHPAACAGRSPCYTCMSQH